MTKDFRFDSDGIARVELRIDDGRIAVEPSDSAGTVEVVFRNRARAGDRDGARALLERVRINAVEAGDTIRVRARSKGRSIAGFGGNTRTDVSLRVPDGMTMDLRTQNGRIELEGITGNVRAETGDGRIHLASTAGTFTLETNDGSVIGTELSGSIEAISNDGRIQLEGDFEALRAVTADGSIRIVSRASQLTHDWVIRTSDGSIELVLPADLSARIDATSADGRIVHDLTQFRGSVRSRRLKGTLGGGGPLVLVTTMDGRIVLEES